MKKAISTDLPLVSHETPGQACREWLNVALTGASALLTWWRFFRGGRKPDANQAETLSPPNSPEAAPTVPVPMAGQPAGQQEQLLKQWLHDRRARLPYRFKAVTVGISDYASYGTRVASLPWCAEDARNVAQSLEKHGAAVVCLTDHQATVGAVASAFQRIAAEAKAFPNTVVWLFYSGHGVRSMVSAQHLDEWDERQDGLLLADGPLDDDRFAALVQSLPQETPLVVALDCCHSAGLLTEAFRRNGPTLFLASSDEDATSQVAAEYRVGGYLSYCLLDALNTVPPGEKLTAGWVQDSILERWTAVCKHKQSVYDYRGRFQRGRQWPTVVRTARRDQLLAGTQ